MRRRSWLAGLAALAALALAWSLLGEGGAGLPLVARATPPPLPDALPRVGLERVDRERPASELGRRDVFAFGPVQPLATPTPAPTPEPSPGVPAPIPRPPVVAAAPAVAPLNVSFIGIVEGPRGLRVAVLEAAGRDLLTGREGDLVANRLEIVKIGIESIDVRDVGSDRVRRLPLEGAR